MSRFSPPDPAAPLGGRYALGRPLGEGAFAVTYLAEDLVLGRLVAVKVLRARYGSDPAAAARFEREARAAASVSSPYIVDVFDYGTAEGASYIVLQYVPGPTLRDLIDQAGRLAPRDAVRIAVDVLRGLAVIHRAGIIHRDVKPHNVLIDQNGTARVTDFGVALWSGTETLTSHGLAVGTAVYMAPEQAQGAEVTETADLYAVGVMLYEMLTGRPPFRADNPTTLMLAHVQQAPPLPTAVVPELTIPPALQDEVMQALAKDPRDRRQSAQAMATALAAAASEIGATHHGAAGPSSSEATTASIPSLGRRVAAATRADAATVAAPARRVRAGLSRAWLGPLALLLVALVMLGFVTLSGGFSGLIGGPATEPADDGNLAVVVDDTPAPTMTPAPAAPTTPPQPAAPPTALPTTTSQSLFPTRPAGAVPTVSQSIATEPVAPTPTPLPETPTPPPPATELPTAIPPTPTTESIAPTEVAQQPIADPSAIQFPASDWEGALPADPAFGRDAVALFGAEGPSARAVLRFELAEAPSGNMVLTITGLGDESGLVFPFGIEVNGYYAGQGTSAFDNWQPGRDGVNGEQATWDQVRFALPPEIFQAGLNEIAIVSLSPGDYDDRAPYLLLAEATLEPG